MMKPSFKIPKEGHGKGLFVWMDAFPEEEKVSIPSLGILSHV